MRVLLVEDSPYDAFDISTKIRSIFPNAVVEHVITARDGMMKSYSDQNALYEFIFVDQHMPGGTGTEFCRKFRQCFGEGRSKLILLTSDGTNGTRAKALASNCDGFLQKPANQNRLRTLLDGSRCHWDMSDLPTDLDLYRTYLQA